MSESEERREGTAAADPAMDAAFRESEAAADLCQYAAQAWFFAHHLFRPPDAEQWAWMQSTETAAIRAALFEALGLPAWRESDLPRSHEEYETEFIAAFDAGAPTPLIPLLESHYNKRDPVPRILHENILFHKAFGLSLKDSSAETADHLRFQMEFAGYLYQLEHAAWESGGDPKICEQIQTARHDFITRHLLSWLPAAGRKAAESPFSWAVAYLALVTALANLAVAE